jgi:ribosomal protein S18 acetylase RimI-like enzyme
MKIRLYEDEDQDDLLNVLEEGLKVQETYAAEINPPENDGFFQEEWEEHLSGLKENPEEWSVYEKNGRIVGLLWLRFLPDELGPYATVREIIVTSEFRNLGIGTQLLDHAEDLARKRSVDSFLISGLISNPAIGLYRRQGFTDFPDKFKNDKNPNHVVLWKPYSERLRNA